MNRDCGYGMHRGFGQFGCPIFGQNYMHGHGHGHGGDSGHLSAGHYSGDGCHFEGDGCHYEGDGCHYEGDGCGNGFGHGHGMGPWWRRSQGYGSRCPALMGHDGGRPPWCRYGGGGYGYARPFNFALPSWCPRGYGGGYGGLAQSFRAEGTPRSSCPLWGDEHSFLKERVEQLTKENEQLRSTGGGSKTFNGGCGAGRGLGLGGRGSGGLGLGGGGGCGGGDPDNCPRKKAGLTCFKNMPDDVRPAGIPRVSPAGSSTGGCGGGM